MKVTNWKPELHGELVVGVIMLMGAVVFTAILGFAIKGLFLIMPMMGFALLGLYKVMRFYIDGVVVPRLREEIRTLEEDLRDEFLQEINEL